jgi:Helix-turn-helix.
MYYEAILNLKGRNIMEHQKLRGRIREVYHSESEFAKAFGMGRGTLSAKLNGKTAFDVPEISKCCKLLGIESKDINIYFFLLLSS